MSEDPNADTDGRGALRDELAAAEPPAELAERVRGTLERRGLVRHVPRRRPAWAIYTGLVAAGFLIGILTRGTLPNDDRPTGSVAGEYVLLLYGDPVDDTGTVHVAREREYGRWASSLSDGTRWVGGHELGDVVADIQPASRTSLRSDRLAGYFVIQAPSRDRATEVARSTPHLAYGGRVVLMAIEP
jgi:hypothetical protein